MLFHIGGLFVNTIVQFRKIIFPEYKDFRAVPYPILKIHVFVYSLDRDFGFAGGKETLSVQLISFSIDNFY